MTIVGDKPMDFARQFLSKETVFEIRLPSRGYHYVLDPPLPVNVLEGEIKGDAKKPVAGYVAMPWAKYPPGLPVPAAPEGAEAKAGGGGGARRRAPGRRLMARAWQKQFWPGGAQCGAGPGSAGDGGGCRRRGCPRGRRRPRAAPAAPKPQGPNVRIVFTVVPNTKKATVTWGKKKLGLIGPHAPLIVQRPRDSGPLDVVVRADGCVPVQTRAYTFEDSKVAVKVTPHEQKNTLLGYPRRSVSRRRRRGPIVESRRRRALVAPRRRRRGRLLFFQAGPCALAARLRVVPSFNE